MFVLAWQEIKYDKNWQQWKGIWFQFKYSYVDRFVKINGAIYQKNVRTQISATYIKLIWEMT